ncbi:hypothetical protein ACHAPU_010139 [Fusarium lateritium]
MSHPRYSTPSGNGWRDHVSDSERTESPYTTTTTSQPTPRGHTKVSLWARHVPKSSVQDQFERMGHEYKDKMMDMHEFSTRQGKIWAQM